MTSATRYAAFASARLLLTELVMRFGAGPLAGCLGLITVAAATTFACGVPDPTNYGSPGAINGRKPPAAESDDGGATSGTTGGGTTGAAAVCTEATFVDGGACAVTWSGDIFPKIQTTWNCGSASGCHATTDPKFTAVDSKATYNALRAWTGKGSAVLGIPYINPCSTDATKSYFARNIAGNAGTTMPLGIPTTTDDQAKIATWVKCGAPFN